MTDSVPSATPRSTSLETLCHSVFETIFDVAVCGAGTIGFAAARALTADGRKVLLVEPSGSILWESTVALENRTCEGTTREANLDNPWTKWIARIHEIQGGEADCFDPALVETLAARDLEITHGLSTLLYAMPVAATVAVAEANGSGSAITGVTVATKSGPRLIVARQWVDATENGILARICNVNEAPRRASANYRSLVLQSPDDWAEFPSVDQMPASGIPGARWFASVRGSERRLTWPVPVEGSAPWHEDILSATRLLRQSLPNTSFLVSHCSQKDYPVYEAGAESAESAWHENGISNLLVLSPGCLQQPIACVSDRFLLGASAPARLSVLSTQTASASYTFSVNARPAFPAPVEERVSEVLVAGTGTGGVLAALAAGGQGANTLALDISVSPGGIGTDGGITRYCHGMPGGLQQKLDELSAEYSELLYGFSAGFGVQWHHLGKRLAILTLFAEAGVQFCGETILCDVEMDMDARTESDSDSKDIAPRKVRAVLGAVDGRMIRFLSTTYVDSTGDGDLCAMAGADYEMGRSEDGVCLSYSQVGFSVYKTAKGFNIGGRNYDAGYVDATDPEDLSRARLRGLAQYLRAAWNDPSRPVAFGPSIGLRQSRQIRTDATLTFRDIIAGSTYPDAIGGTMTFADTHAVDYEFESDQSLFYYWICQSFREPLRCELPYRILLPNALDNVWIACRASGLSVAAAYAVRMQRDVQRLGEAAGIAAALVAKEAEKGGARLNSRSVNLQELREKLRSTGACAEVEMREKPDVEALAALLESGRAGVHLWHIYQQPDAALATSDSGSGKTETLRSLVERLLQSSNPVVSFNSAAILAMWKSHLAEERLLRAIRDREPGPAPEGSGGKGAFAQDIDIPYWLSAVVLLRCCGSSHALPLLQDVATQEDAPFNQRTCIALTVERLARREVTEQIVEIHNLLLHNLSKVAILPPSRSLRRMMEGREQRPLHNDIGSDTCEDLSWQLYLVLSRTRQTLGLPVLPEISVFRTDERRYVRRAFQGISRPKSVEESPARNSLKKSLHTEPSYARP
ncbi:MAG: FAD-dependent oxidoreductase [Candidatus Methylacidiphilales bacterium]|nr:FAD-dependent oxidoreductase [Candidatus Methylacidiphilales bacterium]